MSIKQFFFFFSLYLQFRAEIIVFVGESVFVAFSLPFMIDPTVVNNTGDRFHFRC